MWRELRMHVRIEKEIILSRMSTNEINKEGVGGVGCDWPSEFLHMCCKITWISWIDKFDVYR